MRYKETGGPMFIVIVCTASMLKCAYIGPTYAELAECMELANQIAAAQLYPHVGCRKLDKPEIEV